VNLALRHGRRPALRVAIIRIPAVDDGVARSQQGIRLVIVLSVIAPAGTINQMTRGALSFATI